MRYPVLGLTLAVAAWIEPSFVQADADVAAVVLAEQGRQPRIGVGPDGTVAVAYGQGAGIFCRVSRDGGRTYGDPARLATVEGLHLGMGRGPQVAVTPKGVIVAAIGKAGDIVTWHSADGGRSWAAPVTVNAVAGAAREGLLSLAAGQEAVHAVWLDLRQGAAEVWVAKSLDVGATWTERLLYHSPDGHVCECCQPTMGADGEGGVAVMFRNWLAGSRDMHVLVSRDEGATFGPATQLGSGTWPLDGCPMDGGGVALLGPRLMTVWRREKDVYASTGAGIEVRLGAGRNAAVALARQGAVVAWEDGGIRLKEATTAAPRFLGPGTAPSLAALPGGGALLAWERPGGGILIAPVRPVAERGMALTR